VGTSGPTQEAAEIAVRQAKLLLDGDAKNVTIEAPSGRIYTAVEFDDVVKNAGRDKV
jgi:hypothetical protein